jgi:hypothetical protein
MFNDIVKAEVKNIIERIMEGVLHRRLVINPWNLEQEVLCKPFHFALAPEIVWKGAKFERSLVTSMGQIGWEQIAMVISQGYHGYAENGKAVHGQTFTGRLNKIHIILDQLEHKRNPDWDKELTEILAVIDGIMTDIHVTSDLFVHNLKFDKYFYFEIKAPKPNSDQTKVSKEKMLKIKSLYPSDKHQVFFALPFNPYITRQNYGHPHPKRWFDMINDKCVLIGKEFWDLIGGAGAYEELLKIFEEVGREYRPHINREYFGFLD